MSEAAGGPPGAGADVSPQHRPPQVPTRPGRSMFEPSIVRRAALEAFVKLDPRRMVRVPVMFLVEVGSVITTVQLIADPSLFAGLITAWLWGYVLFRDF